MKLQGMTILYIIIIIPMLIVISLTLSFYKEQLNKKIEYNSELTGAVNDAITAFELNSSGQDYSNVSDNFTSLVEASVNIFRRSIATRLNMTNADENLMNRYFPLALFTGYNGYYIYSPTYAPVVVKNPYTGQAAFSSDASGTTLEKNSAMYEPDKDTTSLQYTPVLLKHKDHDNSAGGTKVRVTTNKNLLKNGFAKEEIDYSLKQMIPYTVELEQNNDNKIFLNFTLDNYISFFGKVKGISYNKSGYLLDHETSVKLTQAPNNEIYNMNKITDKLPISHLTYFDEYVDDYIENEMTKVDSLFTLEVTENEENFKIIFNPVEYRAGYDDHIAANRKQMTGQYAYQKQQLDAIKYYIKAANFSNFVYTNLGDYREEHIKEIELIDDIKNYEKYFIKYNKSNSDRIFTTASKKGVLDYDSTFNEIKRKVIRNSLQYDLIIATENYNYLVSSSDFILNLPVITDNDWERIIENISFTVFLQGLSIGANKTYNDYAIATSTMNEFVINSDTIFFANVDGFNEGHKDSTAIDDLYYHKIDCPTFIEDLVSKDNGTDHSTGAIGFKMGEWLYDARWSREEASFEYDHKNYSHFNCISNYNVKDNLSNKEKEILQKNLYSALAAEKERSFKPNKIVDGGGYKTFTSSTSSGMLNISAIRGFEVASDKIDSDLKSYSITIRAKGVDYNYTDERRTSVIAYPSNTTEINKSKYTIHRDFINQFGSGVFWDDITSVNITATDLSYIKILYI